MENRIKNKYKIVVDADDVLIQCNEIALEMLEKETGEIYSLENITAWGTTGTPIDERIKFFSKKEFYESQKKYQGADAFLQELMKKGDVFIVTAVSPEFMGDRIKTLINEFPFFPMDHIIMGYRKDLIHSDIMLDDGLHNLEKANSEFPVLFRKPWNKHVPGMAAVSNYAEFIALVDTIQGNVSEAMFEPKVYCIIGPSGSKKNELADTLCQCSNFARVPVVTTGNSKKYVKVGSDFMRTSCFETSYYAGEAYGCLMVDIELILKSGSNAVCVMDLTGSMSIRSMFPYQSVIIYKDLPKRACLENTLKKDAEELVDQLVDRILAMDYEYKYASVADISFHEDDTLGIAEKIIAENG